VKIDAPCVGTSPRQLISSLLSPLGNTGIVIIIGLLIGNGG
jgi:hypothetical protein